MRTFFLNRLTRTGGGVCELVESEARLEEVMDKVHRLISTPVLTDLRLDPARLEVQADTVTPARLPSLFAGVPVTILGRWSGKGDGSLTLKASEREEKAWTETPRAVEGRSGALAALWARGRIRDLEDAYADSRGDRAAAEKEIVATSLRFGVLSRFTAYVAVDRAAVVEKDGELHRVVQPVEMPAEWEHLMHCISLEASRRSLLETGLRCLRSSDADGSSSIGAVLRHERVPARPTRRGLVSRLARTLRRRRKVAAGRSLDWQVGNVLKDLRTAAHRGAKACKALHKLMERVLDEIASACARGETVAPASIERIEKLCREIEAALGAGRLDPAAVGRLFAACETALMELLASLRGESPPVRSKEFWK